MNSLKQIVLPLADSRALVDAGIVLETAMVWAEYYPDYAYSAETRDYLDPDGDERCDTIPAPVLSELLDAIRAKKACAVFTLTGRSVILQDGSTSRAHDVAEGISDLLAAAALLLEVSK